MSDLNEEINRILWAVHQNGVWYASPIMDRERNILPPEKLARYGMDVQEAEEALKQAFDKHVIPKEMEMTGREDIDYISRVVNGCAVQQRKALYGGESKQV